MSVDLCSYLFDFKRFALEETVAGRARWPAGRLSLSNSPATGEPIHIVVGHFHGNFGGR